MRFEKRTTINAPAQKIFEYVADVTRHGEWGKYPHEARKTSDGPIGIGTTFASVGKQFGDQPAEVRIVEYDPPSKVVLESSGKNGLFRHSFLLSDNQGVTTVTKIMEGVKPALALKIFAPIIALNAPKMIASDLARIKANVEGSA